MTRFILLILVILLTSCNKKSPKRLFFLDQNAYEHPVWEELMQLEKVRLSDVESAFEAYTSTHEISNETKKIFEKYKKKAANTLDSEGYYYSELGLYKKHLRLRKALPDSIRTTTDYSRMQSSYTKSLPNSSNLGHWKNVGPFGIPDVRWNATGNGAVQYLEMHPTNPAIMYACTRNGGLWKTVNSGKNWTPETDHFVTDNTSCITINQMNPAIMYLGAAEDQKIWYSSDNGNNWSDRSSGIDGNIYDIHSDPTNPARAIAATTTGIYLTTNSGNLWTRKVTGSFTDFEITDNWDLIITSKDENNISPTLFFTTNKGDTFIEKNIITHLPQVDRFYLGIHKPSSGPTQVLAYGIKNSNTPTRFIGLWKSDFTPNPSDGTSYFNFTQVKHPTYTYPNGTVPLVYDASNANGFIETTDYYGSLNPYHTTTWIGDFYVSPNDPNKFLMFREKVWGSEDGGIIWEFKPSYGGSHWADNRFVCTNINKDTVYWCNDGGIWAIKEADLYPTAAELSAAGVTNKYAYMSSKVVDKNGDICVSEGSQMHVSGMNKGVFMTGGQDIGQIFIRNGRESHVASADVYRGRIKPHDDSKFITGSLTIKPNGGTDYYSVYNDITADHFNPDRIYGFTIKNITQNTNKVLLVRSPANKDGWLVNNFSGENFSNTGGHSWAATHDNWEIVDISSTGISQLNPYTFHQSTANKDLAFLGDELGKRMFYTTNLSSSNPTWQQLNNAPATSIYRIATHQYNENLIAIATNNGVYISKDKGVTWINRGMIPTTNPFKIIIDKTTSEGMYVMTGLTVFYIDEHLNDWVEFNKGLPLQNLTDMHIAYYPDNDNRIYVSKYGRGIWASNLQSVLRKNEDKPTAAFTIHGTSSATLSPGEKVKLLDQSLNATSLQWTLENGTDIININNEKTPEITLNTPGYYKVTLVATNGNGSDTQVKERYILVNTLPVESNCTITNSGTVPWYKRIGTIQINSDIYTNPSNNNYIQTSKLFKITKGQTSTIHIKDNYQPGFNFYTKAWIDYNNDGILDANEEIATSNGRAEELTVNFTPPPSAVLFKQLLMRVVGLEHHEAPIPCQSVGTRQIIDFRISIENDLTITPSHTISSVNSSNLQANFTDAHNVVSAGFVYSNFNGNLNMNNSNVITYNNSLSNNDNFSSQIENLNYNTTYYYKAFIVDDSGIKYSDTKSFTLTPHKIPLSESLIAINLGNNQWQLKGMVYPENNILNNITLEYGAGNFNSSASFNPSNYSSNTQFTIDETITIAPENQYQFRVKLEANNQTYYSNIKQFNTATSPCIGQGTNLWYRKIANVTFNGQSNNSSGGNGYQDFSSIVFEVTEGNTYNLSITDSYSPGFNFNYKVLIDYNNDNDFDDYHETVIFNDNGNVDTLNTTITIPLENVVYDTNLRMRIMGFTGSTTSHCTVSQGEIEDYSIKIAENTLSTNESSLPNLITNVYPNPASHYITVELENEHHKDYICSILNSKGQILHQNSLISNKHVINIKNLASGQYFITLSKGNRKKTIQFLKE